MRADGTIVPRYALAGRHESGPGDSSGPAQIEEPSGGVQGLGSCKNSALATSNRACISARRPLSHSRIALSARRLR